MDDFPGWSNDQAFTEGWGIFEMDPPLPSGERFQLQYLQDGDFSADAWPDRWYDDLHAWRFVQAQASYGHAYHIAALDWLRTHSPIEHERITAGSIGWALK